jgi:hypothetical protein
VPSVKHEVSNTSVFGPTIPGPSTLETPLYADINCECSNGTKLKIRFLRPDTYQLHEGSPPLENSYNAGEKSAVAYERADRFEHHRRMIDSAKPLFVSINPDYPNAHGLHAVDPTGPVALGSGDPPNLDAWIQPHISLRRSFLWVNPDGETQYYDYWSADRKEMLQSYFEAIWRGEALPLPDPPPNIYSGFGDAPAAALSENDAWQLYISHVAHSFAVEIAQVVPWSLSEFGSDPTDGMYNIFFNYAFIVGPWNAAGFEANGYVTYDDVLPAPPQMVYRFLVANDLIGATRKQTIGRVIGWCRDNLHCYTHKPGESDNEAHWQYPVQTVSRTLTGTECTTFPEKGIRRWTKGSHGTTQFLIALLRVINIPVEKAHAANRSTPHFLLDDLYLSDGEDPYCLNAKTTPPFPADKLLIDKAIYNAWLDPDLDQTIRELNVGRRAVELGIQYLPDDWLYAHWRDIEEGNPIDTNCHVYQKFVKNTISGPRAVYDLDTLQNGSIATSDGTLIQCDLWNRLDQKIAGFGKLLMIPPQRPRTLWYYIWQRLNIWLNRLRRFVRSIFDGIRNTFRGG